MLTENVAASRDLALAPQFAFMSSEPPRILVIRRRYLGDIVLLGQFLHSLRCRWPNAEIDLLVEPAYAAVAALNTDITGVLPLPGKDTLWPWVRLARTLRNRRYSHVLNLDNTEKTAVLARLTGAQVRAGLYLADQKLRLSWAYTTAEAVEPEFRRSQHITAFYNRLLKAIDVEVCPDWPLLTPSAADLRWAESFRPAAGARPPRVLLHPGSRSAFRIWPAENFARVCDELQASGAATITLVAGPAEQTVVAKIKESMRTTPHEVGGVVTVGQLAALAQTHDLFLCHDSGPMHLAAAVGTPVVALFSSQNLNEWRPLGQNSIALQPPLPCVNCVAPHVCVPSDSYRNYCVRNITVDEVLAAIRRLLAAS